MWDLNGNVSVSLPALVGVCSSVSDIGGKIFHYFNFSRVYSEIFTDSCGKTRKKLYRESAWSGLVTISYHFYSQIICLCRKHGIFAQISSLLFVLLIFCEKGNGWISS